MAERISKVAFKEGRVVVHTADEVVGERERKSEIKLYRDPHKDFTTAFSALEVHLRAILELPSNVWKDKIRITGVSFSCNEDSGVEGAVMTAQAALDNADAPLCFNTPHLPFEQYSEGGVAKLMPEDAIEALNELRDQARQYLDGKAAQADLFAGSDESDEPRREAGSYAAEAPGIDDKIAALRCQRYAEEVAKIGRAHGMPADAIDAVIKAGEAGRADLVDQLIDQHCPGGGKEVAQARCASFDATVNRFLDQTTEVVAAIVEPHLQGDPDYERKLTKALDSMVGP